MRKLNFLQKSVVKTASNPVYISQNLEDKTVYEIGSGNGQFAKQVKCKKMIMTDPYATDPEIIREKGYESAVSA